MSLLKRTTHQPQPVESIPEPKQGFIQIDFADIDTVIDKKLTAAEMKLWLYLSKIDRFGDRFVDLPTPKELAIRLGLSQRTVEKAMFRLDELKLYTIRIKAWQGANSSAARARQTAEALKQAKKDRTTPKPLPDKDGYLAANPVNFSEAGKINRESEKLTENPANFSDADIYRSHAYSDSKDISNPPDRSGEGGKNAYEEPERSQSKPASLTSKPEELTRQVETSSEDKSSAAACNDLLQVLDSLGVLRKAQALLNKMEELEIKPCQGYSAERIAGVIKECHLSQLWGALRHIEETWESIRNPTAIFCSKAPKMPIEVEHRLPEFDRAAHDEKMAQATTPEASKAYIEKIKSEKIKAIASSSGDKRLRKFADLIPSMPSSKPNTDFDTDYAAEQRRLARQMMEDSGDAAT